MFEKKTVLVLGAGASCHYGYPTGEKLIDDILNTIKTGRFNYGRNPENAQINLYRDEPKYRKLHDSLKFYDPLSIDSFLSQFNEREMIDAGKSMIVYEMLKAENKHLLLRNADIINSVPTETRPNNWYRFLHNALTSNAKPQHLIENELNLRVVTFNYDNSLEYFLYSRFYNSPLFANGAVPFLKKLSENIIHIYGQVGRFDWTGGQDRQDEDYGQYKGNTALSFAEDKWKDFIHVIGKERDQYVEKNAQKAMDWLTDAEAVYFLGFGFIQENVELLKLWETCSLAQKIYCTNLNGSKIITDKIDTLFNRAPGVMMTLNDKGDYLGTRKANVSVKKVYPALAEDFSLLA